MKAVAAVLAALIAVAVLMYVYTSPAAPPAEMTEAEIAEVEAEVEQIMRGLYASVADADVGPWMEALADPAGPWLLDTEIGDLRETSNRFEAEYDSQVTQALGGLEIQVDAISRTVVFVAATVQDREWHLADGTIDRSSTAETWVFVATDNGWKLYAGQSAIFPKDAEVVEEG
jgi:hypothetical protein